VFDTLRKTVRPLTNIARSLIDSVYAPALFALAGRKADEVVGARQPAPGVTAAPNPLETFFDSHRTGPGVWKWRHYFEAYHTHFSRFRGKRPKIVEIGVYSGGSLEMWREYFGEGCELYGVDINPACRQFQKNGVTIKIANQSDRSFWRKFREEVGDVDIVIDDGGHRPRQQRPTFEEILRGIKPGGVYLCEDVHGLKNPFAAYLRGVANRLNDDSFNAVQAAVKSVSFYPYIAVVELFDRPLTGLKAEQRGDRWI
jgi:SAM-dependent methyltransferase